MPARAFDLPRRTESISVDQWGKSRPTVSATPGVQSEPAAVFVEVVAGVAAGVELLVDSEADDDVDVDEDSDVLPDVADDFAFPPRLSVL